jgi:gas vesicle protein
MPKVRKSITKVIGLLTVGYVAGLLTAPRSGQRTRKRLQKSVNIQQIEREFKSIYSENKDLLNKVSKIPKFNSKFKEIENRTRTSQKKIKNILSSLHGQDNLDEDLEAALSRAKESLNELRKFIKK